MIPGEGEVEEGKMVPGEGEKIIPGKRDIIYAEGRR